MKRLLRTLPCLLVCMAFLSCSASPVASTTINTPQPSQTIGAVQSTEPVAESPASSQTAAPTQEPKIAIIQISVGYKACYILRSDGSLWAWGNNEYGQIGDGTHDTCTQFKKILDGVKKITSNQMAIKNDNTLWVWGGDHLTPYQYASNVKDANGHYILMDDGSLLAYGSRLFTLGDGKPSDRESKETIPLDQAVKIMSDVRSIPVAGETSMAIKNDGSLWIWGNPGELLNDATDKQMFDAMKGSVEILTPVKIMENVINAASMNFLEPALLALEENGTLFQWGAFLHVTKLYEKDPIPKYPAIQFLIKEKVSAVSAYGTSAFAILDDGRLVTWGAKYKDEPKGLENPPTSLNEYVEIAKDVQAVSAGVETLLVLKKDGSLLAAGKACYDVNQHDAVSESMVLAPAFQEMWGMPVLEPTPTSTDAPVSSGLSHHMDNRAINADFEYKNASTIVAVTGTLDGQKKVLFVYTDNGRDYGYKNSVKIDAFSGLPVLEDTSAKDMISSLKGTIYMQGKWKTTDFSTLDLYFSNLKVDLKSVKTGKDLRMVYEQNIPPAEWYITPEDIRGIDNNVFVETFMINGQEKLLLVYRVDYETVTITNDKVKYISCYDFINGYNICDPYMVLLYSAHNNNQPLTYDYNEFGIIPKTPHDLIPFSKYFKKIKYKKVMTQNELIEFYKVNIPQDKQYLLPQGTGLFAVAKSIVDFLNFSNIIKPDSFISIPKWGTFNDLCISLQGVFSKETDTNNLPLPFIEQTYLSIIIGYSFSDDDYQLWTDEQVKEATKFIVFDSSNDTFSLNYPQ